MDDKQRWLLFAILVVSVLILFNVNFLGFATYNDTTSEVTVRGENTPPVLAKTQGQIFVCESDNLFYVFNASDIDNDALTARIAPDSTIFTVLPYGQFAPDIYRFAIVSGEMGKGLLSSINSGFRSFFNTITVDDDFNDTCCMSSVTTNITLIEINNVPLYEDIGVKTIYLEGEDSNFYKEWNVTDIEYSKGYGNLIYTIRIINESGNVGLFNINNLGVMNFTPNENVTLGVYNITVCAQDTGLTTIHPNISEECGVSGSANKVCDDFQLTITDENRPPEFLGYFPNDLGIVRRGTNIIYFNITKHDPDGNTPNSYWFVDGAFKSFMSGSGVDEFRYSFGCGVTGQHSVRVVITDGLANASLTWNITLSPTVCGTSSSGGGGGGAPPPFLDFTVDPYFITTTLIQQQGKSFDIFVNNTGEARMDFTLDVLNISDMVILSDEVFSLNAGESKLVKLYLYSLSETPQNVYFGSILVDGEGIEKFAKIVVEVKEREPLFDVKVTVPREYKYVLPGDDLAVLTDMLNVGMYGTAVDVGLYLYITDLDKILIYERQKEVLAVETNLTVNRILNIPFSTNPGTYLVLGEMTYGNITISTYDTFNVGEKKYVRVSYFLIIVIVLALIIIILFILYKRRKDKRERGYR